MRDPACVDVLQSFGTSVNSYQLGTTVIGYTNSVIEKAASQDIHCPELNACFLKQNQGISCDLVHYGYAVPVSVLPLDNDPSLVELVLDVTTDIEPAVASYLLKNHPDFEHIRQGEDLETIISEIESNFDLSELDYQLKIEGKNDDKKSVRRGSEGDNMTMAAKHDHVMGKFTEPEEDIAAIAKQISDHAEAIYQTWKSRGLAPTEILTCHSNATAADKFGTALTPRNSKTRSPSPANQRPSPPVVDILSSSPSLDANKLERLVNTFVEEDKARQKTMPSSIQHALQKFEKKASSSSTSYRSSPQPTQISRPIPANQIKLETLDTIEMILPEEVVRRDTPQPPKRGLDFQTDQSTNVTTWPFKNKIDLKKKDKSSEYLDEVQREEQRLIDALKAGVVLADERSPIDGASVVIGQTEGQVKQHTVSSNKLLKNAILETISGKEQNKNLSLVDYAKIRYKNAQENPVTQQRLEQSKQFDKTTGQSQVISITRNRFEIGAVKQVSEHWKTKEVGEWPVDEVDTSEDKKMKNRNRHSMSESVPHPELTSQQKQHLKQAGSNPVRPFLTRGSVAERVLIFEKCPTELLLDKRRSAPAITTWRTGHEVQSKAQTYVRDKENQRSVQQPPPHTTLQRHTKANRNVFIPRFYYPQGKPHLPTEMDKILQKLAAEFRTFPMGQVTRDKFHIIVKACECPLYWKVPLFSAAGGEKLGYVEAHTFLDYWKQLASSCHDQPAKFLKILVKGEPRNYVSPEDFISLIQDVVDTHPGLTFLKEATEFHSRYVHTVIARIYYNVNRSWSGQITLPELRRSNLLQVISLLEEEEDINQITQYFSYEHFYVIYCKFWELDRDHDLFIDRQDLARHNDHALSSRIIDRIFSGAVTRGGSKSQFNKMSYTEFVWFLLSEEDKQHATAIEYWFRCMDLDGDGFLSMYELEYFYEEQLQRMELLGIETLPFEDCLCQMLDMLHPKTEGKIALSDLKKCKMVSIFFDTFFNLEKYLDHEQRDPFASQRDHDSDGEMSDWDRYAAEEYELLVAEEGGGNDHNDELCYDTDQSSDDGISPNLDKIIIKDEKDEPTISTIDLSQNPVTVLKTCDSEIEHNGTGSIRIKIQSPNGINSSWKYKTMPSLQVTTCEDLNVEEEPKP